TTLLNIIGTLDKPSSGRALVDGEDITRMNDAQLTRLRRHKIGFVFQFHNLIPVLTALENVELPLITSGVKRKESKDRAIELLRRVGLQDRTDHLPDELSGENSSGSLLRGRSPIIRELSLPMSRPAILTLRQASK